MDRLQIRGPDAVFDALQGHGDEIPALPKPLNICQDSNRKCNDINAEARPRGDAKIG